MTTVKDMETLLKRIEEIRVAQKEFASFSQEKVDEIFRQAAMAANNARIRLAKMAVEETGMGIIEDKVINIKMKKHVVLLREIKHLGLQKLQSLLELLQRLYRQQTRHQQQFLKH